MLRNVKKQDMVMLCNVVNNPAYSNIKDSEIKATIPLL